MVLPSRLRRDRLVPPMSVTSDVGHPVEPAPRRKNVPATTKPLAPTGRRQSLRTEQDQQRGALGSLGLGCPEPSQRSGDREGYSRDAADDPGAHRNRISSESDHDAPSQLELVQPAPGRSRTGRRNRRTLSFRCVGV